MRGPMVVVVSIVASPLQAIDARHQALVMITSAWRLAPCACLLAVGIVLDDELLFHLGVNLVAAGHRQHLSADLLRVDAKPGGSTAAGTGSHGFLDRSCLPAGGRRGDRV